MEVLKDIIIIIIIIMLDQLIDVLTEDGCVMLAKIIDRVSDTDIVVKFMNPVKCRYHDMRVYNFNEVGEIVPIESIAGYYDTDDVSLAGYLSIGIDGFIRTCEDKTYVPDESESESESETDSESDGNSDEDDVQEITCAIEDIDMNDADE